MGQKKSKSTFNIKSAKKLVELCLSEDFLYKDYLTAIKSLNDYQFENLFMGNIESNYNISDTGTKGKFSDLVIKFEDYKTIMYNFYENKKRHKELASLWKKNISITNLCSSNDLEKQLDNMGISVEFKYELKELLQKTIEYKSESILDFIKRKGKYIYALLSFSKNEEKKLNTNSQNDSNNIYSSNMFNMIEMVIIGCLPYIKEYLKSIPNLEPLSKKELESKDNNLNKKIKNVILKAFQKDNSNSYIHRKLLDLVKDFKYEAELGRFFDVAKNTYSNSLFSIIHLALSFLSLNESVNSFSCTINEYKQKRIEFSREFSNIISDFELHKKEIGILEFSNIKESQAKIKEVHDKIYKDKMRLKELVKQITNAIENKKDKKKKDKFRIGLNCVFVLSSIVGIAITTGPLAFLYGGSLASNIASIGFNAAEIKELNKEIKKYSEMYSEALDKEKEIDSFLQEIKRKYNIE